MIKSFMRKTTYIAGLVGILISVLFVPVNVNAAKSALPDCSGSNANAQICQTNTDAIGGILKNVINTMLFLAGSIAVIMIVVGGIRYITSDGDPGAASKAKNTIIYALVGIVVAVMSYAIVNFVIERL